MSVGNIVVSQDAPAKNNLWIQPKGTARFWNGSIWKTLSGGGGGGSSLIDLIGDTPIGGSNPIYWTGENFSIITGTLSNNISGTVNGHTISSTINNGTANRLAYYTNNGIDDASTTYVSDTKLAINSTSVPSYNFYVNGTSYLNGNTTINGNIYFGGTSGYLYMPYNSTNYPIIKNYNNGNVTINACGTGVYFGYENTTYADFLSGKGRWTSTGLGIGLTAPSYKLDVKSSNYACLNLTRDSTASTDGVGIRFANSTAGQYGRFGYSGGYFSWDNSSDSSLMALLQNGNLGVGTTSPAYKLDVAGDIKSSTNIRSIGAGEHYVEVQDTTSSLRCLIDCTNSQQGLWTNGYWNGSSFVSSSLWMLYRTTDGHLILGSNTETKGNFWATGGVTALRTSSSDKRLKKKIKPFNAKQIINKLKPVEFEWNKKANKYNSNLEPNKKNYGLIAQDSDGIVDNFVFDLPDGKGYKGVRYEKLIPILLQAVKEQQKEIDELKQIIKKLKV